MSANQAGCWKYTLEELRVFKLVSALSTIADFDPPPGTTPVVDFVIISNSDAALI